MSTTTQTQTEAVESFIQSKGAVAGSELRDEFYSGVGSRMRRSSNVRVFKLGETRSANKSVGQTVPVYYTVGTARTEVVMTFLFHNQKVLEESNRIGAVTEKFGNVSQEWAEAWKLVEPEIEHDLISSGSPQTPNGTDCPICGETFDYLPQHLPSCASGN